MLEGDHTSSEGPSSSRICSGVQRWWDSRLCTGRFASPVGGGVTFRLCRMRPFYHNKRGGSGGTPERGVSDLQRKPGCTRSPAPPLRVPRSAWGWGVGGWGAWWPPRGVYSHKPSDDLQLQRHFEQHRPMNQATRAPKKLRGKRSQKILKKRGRNCGGDPGDLCFVHLQTPDNRHLSRP